MTVDEVIAALIALRDANPRNGNLLVEVATDNDTRESPAPAIEVRIRDGLERCVVISSF